MRSFLAVVVGDSPISRTRTQILCSPARHMRGNLLLGTEGDAGPPDAECLPEQRSRVAIGLARRNSAEILPRDAGGLAGAGDSDRRVARLQRV